MVGKKIKIAHIVSTFPPYRGGMGNVAFQLADGLSHLKHEITIFTPKRSLSDKSIQSYFKIIKLKPQFRFGNSAIIFQLIYLLFRYKLVHLHYPFLGASTAIILSKLVMGKKQKFILHYHMDLVGRSWKSVVYKIYNKIFLPLLVKFADKILLTSEDYLKNSLLNKYYIKKKEKFDILPNGVNIKYFSPQPKDLQLIHKYQLDKKKIILFVGALDSAHYFKGVNYLIKAFENLNRDDVKLIIVGEGDLKKAYQEMATSFGLQNNVVFTGYIPDEELVRYYNLCDIFVLPSIDKSEAFGMVLLEAMSCSKPVIATDLAGVRKVVTQKVNGLLVKPKNAQQLTNKINLLLDNPQSGKLYGKNGRKAVEEKYSWENITKQLIKIYNLKNEVLPDK